MALPLEQRDDPDTRVSDYLDDRLQTAADLGSLETLLAEVQSRYGLLRQQV
jgi:RAD50-interacting protein 1